MAISYLLKTPRATAAANRLHIATLIGDLSRTAELLAADIEQEEDRTGVRDVSEPAYPVLAQSLRSRRDNLLTTIASLEAVVHRSAKAA